MADWIDLSATQGTGNGTFTAKASDNTTGALRKAKITYTTLGGDTASVNVVQYQKPTVQQQPPYQLQAAGGKTYFSVRSYATWWFRSIYDWITVTDEDGNTVTEGQKISPCGFSTDDCPSSTTTGTRTFTITAAENTSTLSRNDNMSIGWERLDGVTAYSSYITVFQYGAVKKSEMPMKPDAGGSTPVGGTTSWTATTDADWITLTKTSGTKGESVTYEVTENTTGADRVGKITITYSDGTVEIIEVTQKGTDTPYLNVSPETLTIDGEGGTSSVDIDANVCWTVEEYSEPVTENTKIYYTSSDGGVVTPYALSATDASGNSLTYTNSYSNGTGVIEFNGVVKDIDIKFKNCTTLKTFNGVSNKVRLAADASSIFLGCGKLTTLDVSDFDTSKVTTMNSMFLGCSGLTSLKIGANGTIGSSTATTDMFTNLPSSGTLYYPTGMDSTQVTKWTPSGWTAVAY